jgi:hypothetical protein
VKDQADKRKRKRLADRKYQLKKKYGLTLEQYDAMLARQGGRCYICRRRPKRGRNLAVDHDHTKKGRPIDAVRGLLCTNCNHNVLGVVAKHWTPELFRRAADYLDCPPGAFGHPPKLFSETP